MLDGGKTKHDHVRSADEPSHAETTEQSKQSPLCSRQSNSRELHSTLGMHEKRQSLNSSTVALDKRKPASPIPKGGRRLSTLEKDFTTVGKQGGLQCPFASMNVPRPKHHPPLGWSASSLSTRRGTEMPPTPSELSANLTVPSVDPIEADHRNKEQSPPPSANGSASKCPIRFLDQHSPEEVAEYFEKHKHEIPRSHEVCVKRYQSNEASIRQLDAKYGDLVSMIQGLGVKHQPLLPIDGQDEAVTASGEKQANERVSKWAASVSNSSMCSGRADVQSVQDEPSGRENQFDRPLKPVRVGESPSRPWGISVPAVHLPALNISSDDGIHIDSGPQIIRPEDQRRRPVGIDTKGPVALENNHRAAENHGEDGPVSKGVDNAKANSSSPGSQMIFTGPVFIGYSDDQALSLLLRARGKDNTGGR
ncbi:MAG: hypothetical protein M1825_003402 [Sarcosagium campestre]|nr:MAG: hypothetical protein M1825_003402 [Sarcosagium campestre]